MSSAHNMPSLKTRAIHHLVLPVDDLARADARYQALGFTVQDVKTHPFGTGNACVSFVNGTYLEPIAVVDRESLETSIVEGNSFTRRFDAYRFRMGEGFSMLAFQTKDAEADQEMFQAEGYADGPLLEFSRLARQSDGTDTEVGFRVAMTADHRAPDAAMFTCQSLNPDSVASAESLIHANGALGVVSVAIAEPNPTDFQYYLQVLSGQRSVRATSFALEADIDGATVSILTPRAMAILYGDTDLSPARGLRLRAFTIHVKDVAQTREILSARQVTFTESEDRLIVPPAPGQGCILVFEEAPA